MALLTEIQSTDGQYHYVDDSYDVKGSFATKQAEAPDAATFVHRNGVSLLVAQEADQGAVDVSGQYLGSAATIVAGEALNPVVGIKSQGDHFWLTTQDGANVPGSYILDAGLNAVFDYAQTAAANRKDGQDTIASVSGAVTIDLDQDDKDNKLLQMSGDVTGTTLNATRAGTYKIIYEQDVTGGRTITLPVGVLGSAPTLNTGASEKTLVCLYYDGAQWHYLTSTTPTTATSVDTPFTQPTHGFVVGDVGKPMYRTAAGTWALSTGTTEEERSAVLLHSVTDVNTIRVIPRGQWVESAVGFDITNGGASTNSRVAKLANDGSYDHDAGTYDDEIAYYVGQDVGGVETGNHLWITGVPRTFTDRAPAGFVDFYDEPGALPNVVANGLDDTNWAFVGDDAKYRVVGGTWTPSSNIVEWDIDTGTQVQTPGNYVFEFKDPPVTAAGPGTFQAMPYAQHPDGQDTIVKNSSTQTLTINVDAADSLDQQIPASIDIAPEESFTLRRGSTANQMIGV